MIIKMDEVSSAPLLMTPGPTPVSENVRLARARAMTNPDLDRTFFDFYKETCHRLGQILKTKHEVRILGGEGILGLEAACASLTEPGDRVLVLDNGVFGEGFADFVKLYGGDPILLSTDRRRAIEPAILAEFLAQDSAFKYATLVHCDTPSGVLNDVGSLCPLLKKYGILTVVDSVSAIGGEDLQVDAWQVDLALGGSQKALSAPPGLTFLSISPEAFETMHARRTPIASYYANLLLWENYYRDQWFPYTPPGSDICGLAVAIDNILADTGVFDRHARMGAAVRSAVQKAGLKLYLEQDYSNTVSAIEVPVGVDEQAVRTAMLRDYQIMIAGSFGFLAGKVFRIAHMGESARPWLLERTLSALHQTLAHEGFVCLIDLGQAFREALAEGGV